MKFADGKYHHAWTAACLRGAGRAAERGLVAGNEGSNKMEREPKGSRGA